MEKSIFQVTFVSVLLVCAFNFQNCCSDTVIKLPENRNTSQNSTTTNPFTASKVKISSIKILARSSYGNIKNLSDADKQSRVSWKLGPNEPKTTNSSTQPLYHVQAGYQSNDIDAVLRDPPPHEEVAKMARYVVAHSSKYSICNVHT